MGRKVTRISWDAPTERRPCMGATIIPLMGGSMAQKASFLLTFFRVTVFSLLSPTATLPMVSSFSTSRQRASPISPRQGMTNSVSASSTRQTKLSSALGLVVGAKQTSNFIWALGAIWPSAGETEKTAALAGGSNLNLAVKLA